MDRTSRTHTSGLILTGVGSAVMVYLFVTGRTSEPSTYRAALPPCPFEWVTGYECPGCGGTDAASHVANGAWGEAWASHPVGALLAALVVPTFLALLVSRWRGRDLGPPLQRLLPAGLLLIAVATLAPWLVKMLG